jgi:hypothetical protein
VINVVKSKLATWLREASLPAPVRSTLKNVNKATAHWQFKLPGPVLPYPTEEQKEELRSVLLPENQAFFKATGIDYRSS